MTLKRGSDKWLLPEGVDEHLPPQARHVEQLRRQLLDQFHVWGYDLVMPPMIEYVDALSGAGDDLLLQMFKVTDQLSGRTLGIRADMTPQAARIDAHRLQQSGNVRLCYCGEVLHAKPATLAAPRSLYQLGAELYGHQGVESDLEVLRLMVETLQLAGVKQLHLDIGHVGIYRGLVQAAGLNDEQEHTLSEMLQRKAADELDVFVSDTVSNDTVAEALRGLLSCMGPAEILEKARALLARTTPEVRSALTLLEQIAYAVESWPFDNIECFFDLAELRGYHYHTGIVFSAYVPGSGRAIATGGRYDHIGEAFGRARPATGFSTDLGELIAMLGSQSQASGVWAPNVRDAELQNKIDALRAQGVRVVQALPGVSQTPSESGCTQELQSKGDEWVVADL